MGLASPAYASTVAGSSATITAPVVNSTLTISNIGQTVQPGVTNGGNAVESAFVVDVPSGAILQSGVATSASATLGMVNAGVGTALASAFAYAGHSAPAAAAASVATGIAQFGTAPTVATLSLTNSGSLFVVGFADATGIGASAVADVGFGIYQSANGGTGADITLTNTSGSVLGVVAAAETFGGPLYSSAQAVVGQGLTQSALATGSASVGLSNAGTIEIYASALGRGSGTAAAQALVNQGIVQQATADSGAATAALTNSGTIAIAANAVVSVPAYYGYTASPPAYATLDGGILVGAYANGGDAMATLGNTGTITVSANAQELSGLFGDAYASAANLIDVTASTVGGNATASLTNSGTITLTSNALAQNTESFADAHLKSGLVVTAAATSGDATSVVNNSGTLTISATARNTGVGSFGGAVATAGLFIDQEATAVLGDATTTFLNTGTVSLTAEANYGGSFFARASASVSHAIVEYAAAVLGNATVNIVNTGTLTLAADASNGGTYDNTAYARIASGFRESVYATAGTATANFTNAGTLTIRASSLISGQSNVAFDVAAHATAASALLLRASGSAGAYNVALSNSGTLSIAADATVQSPPGSYAAYGYTAPVDGLVSNGIYEYAHPYFTAQGGLKSGGAATVALDNTGSIWIGTSLSDTQPVADAGQSYTRADGTTGPGGVSNGILQGAVAGSAPAIVALNNASGGSITISSSAVAASNAEISQNYYGYYDYNGSADAYANVSGGIVQFGIGVNGTATVGLTNAGIIGIGANAVAAAGHGFAYGSALVRDGIAQSALAVGSAPVAATAALANSGTIVFTATGIGISGIQGDAEAQLNAAILQSATAYGPVSSPATAQLANTGILALNAYAQATGAQYAYPIASITGGITQNAYAQNGTASALIDNTATLAFSATASANGFSGTSVAGITQAIVQSAQADNGTAVAGIENDGSINVTTVATGATTNGMTAYATITDALTATVTANGTSNGLAGLINTGTLTVAANAAPTAAASAIYPGVSGHAVVAGAVDLAAVGATGSYGAAFVNSGTLAVSADATGIVPPLGVPQQTGAVTQAYIGSAYVTGEIDAGVVESATPVALGGGLFTTGGTAQLSAVNSGTMSFDLVETASGGYGYAAGYLQYAIEQTGRTDGGTLGEAIDNQAGATLSISVLANATSTSSQGQASAVTDNAIEQSAQTVNGNATLSLTNEGTITIQATANVANGAGSGNAFALNELAMVQRASAAAYFGAAPVGIVALAVNNSGTINVDSTATATSAGIQAARAVVSGVIDQAPTPDEGVASLTAAIANSGTIAVAAIAHENSTGTGYSQASAAAGYVASQSASNGQGSVAVSLENTGLISVESQANATGGGWSSTANASFGQAYSAAGEIGQTAQSALTTGTASALLTNAGAITFDIAADATGPQNAAAVAGRSFIYFPNAGQIGQTVYVPASTATATLENTGAIAFDIAANATGGNFATANAPLPTGLSQSASVSQVGGQATATLTNAGTITGEVAANAIQTGAAGSSNGARATASAYTVIEQSLGGAGTATLTNTGTIAFDVAARAQSTNAAYAYGAIGTGIGQFGTAYVAPVALALSNNGTLQFTAEATATGATASGRAIAFAVEQNVNEPGSGATNPVTAGEDVANTATILADVHGSFIGTVDAAGFASAGAISQFGSGYAVTETVENAAGATIGAFADLSVSAPAGLPAYQYNWPYETLVPPVDVARAVGIVQSATAYSSGTTVNPVATLAVTNSGTIAVGATLADLLATAGGTAQAEATGVQQLAGTIGTTTTLTNSGTISAVATLTAGAGVAAATATAEGAFIGGKTFTATLTNSGSIAAQATIAGSALADQAFAAGAVIRANDALTFAATNSGSIVAHATVPDVAGIAIAHALGVSGVGLTGTVANTGLLSAAATAGSAVAIGLNVGAGTGTGTLSLTNAGTIAAVATAPQSAGTAMAEGVALTGQSATLTADNTGTIAATATGATAQATGVDLATTGGTATLTLTNGGTVSAQATGPVATATAMSLAGNAIVATLGNTGAIEASATGTTARATAIDLAAAAPAAAVRSFAVATTTTTTPVTATVALTNAGALAAVAKATGASAVATAAGINAVVTGGPLAGTVSNSGVISAQATGPVASASAVTLGGATVTTTLTNTGALTATAIGTTAQAYGVRVTGASAGKTGTGTVTITNAGTITARDSTNGTAYTHGIAIDTTQAPNASVIDLVGQATAGDAIYGDINVNAAGTINVQGGVTTLDGAINDDAGLRGTLNIASGATLKLVEQPSTLPAALAGAQAAVIHVNAFDVASGGTLYANLPATTGVGTAYVAANSATIASGATLDLVVPTKGGLYPDSKSFTVVAAGQLSGNFTTVNLLAQDGSSLTNVSNSVLLSVTADNSCGATSVCLTYTRHSFAAPVGATLTFNQYNVGTALESAYSQNATGGQQALYSHLIADTSTAAYTGQLDQLAGAQYADYLQSLKQLGTSFDGLLINAGDCALASDRTACRSEARGRIWGAFNYVNAVQDNDALATGVHANDYQMALGTDVSLGKNVALGLGGAYVWSTNRYDRYAGQIRAQGLQVGGYGVWSDGVFNAKGAFGFTGIDGYGQRGITIGTGATALTGTEHGKLNATVWSLTGQVGARYAYGALVAEPYVRADYTRAKLDSFNEDGVPGADLDVGGGRNNRVATMVGIKWSGAFGNVSPLLDAAWRHLYGTPRAFETSAFAFAPSDAFSIASSAEARDQAVVAAGLGATVGRGISVKMSYQGAFGKQGRSNGAQLAIVVPLGR